jgi:hypothetical protein
MLLGLSLPLYKRDRKCSFLAWETRGARRGGPGLGNLRSTIMFGRSGIGTKAKANTTAFDLTRRVSDFTDL